MSVPYLCWMIRRDMPDVLGIERASFEQPWTEEEFLAALRQRNVIGCVASVSGLAVGFMVYELHKDNLHVLNLAVHPRCRRTGVGTALVGKLAVKLSTHRRTSITVDVGEENTSALLFLRARGFRAVGMCDGAVRMEYRAGCDVDLLLDRLTYGGSTCR